MNEYELAEVDLKQGEQRIRLRRGFEPVVQMAHPAQAPAPAAQAAPSPGAAPAANPAPVDESNVAYVTSPMVGTFYTSSGPDAAPFVSVGDTVGPGTVVCILEAMKVFNEIPADCSGKILARLAENGDAIEYGQKLFKLQKS
jgi:acetyl-CoA carboxylase biotin carboxyl carrier protein